MAATGKLLDLHLSQTQTALLRAKSFSYSDKHKEYYHKNLYDLYAKIESSISTKPPSDDTEIFRYKRHLDFIFKSLEFLGSSTLNLIPYEIVECLSYALEDWLEKSAKDYIIVTSLINNVQEFSFDPSLVYDDSIYIDIHTQYAINFDKRLIQINLPRSLSRDYLSSVVLYHELGHFIEQTLSIIDSLTIDLAQQYKNGQINAADLASIEAYIPFFKVAISRGQEVLIQSHLEEYYCDLFASQYVGESSNNFLTYITENSPKYSTYHPSTQNRILVVSDFLSGNNNTIVKVITEAVKKVTGKDLKKRFDNIISDDFYNLLPLTINTREELHGIFEYAWKVWLDDNNDLSAKMDLPNITHDQVYRVVNNLTEKSISNYITVNKWQKAKT